MTARVCENAIKIPTESSNLIKSRLSNIKFLQCEIHELQQIPWVISISIYQLYDS